MRIISGKARGKKLKSLPGSNTRPTTDRVKEALFNILSSHLEGCSFLDLFAGNGGIGIEALSREAEKVVFIEQNPRCVAIIKENLKAANLVGEVYQNDVLKALKLLRMKQEVFDIIFLDPPYERGLIAPVLRAICENSLLAIDGIVVAECGKKEDIPESVSKLTRVRLANYGTTVLAFYKFEEGSCEK